MNYMKITLIACRTKEIQNFGPVDFADKHYGGSVETKRATVLEMCHTHPGLPTNPVLRLDVELPNKESDDQATPSALRSVTEKFVESVAKKLWADESSPSVVRGRLLRELLVAANKLDEARLKSTISQMGENA